MCASFHEIVCYRKRNAASTDVLLSFRPLAENPSHPRGGWSLERAPLTWSLSKTIGFSLQSICLRRCRLRYFTSCGLSRKTKDLEAARRQLSCCFTLFFNFSQQPISCRNGVAFFLDKQVCFYHTLGIKKQVLIPGHGKFLINPILTLLHHHCAGQQRWPGWIPTRKEALDLLQQRPAYLYQPRPPMRQKHFKRE